MKRNRNICQYMLMAAMVSFAGIRGTAQGIIIPSGAYVIQNEGNLGTAAKFTNNGSFTANGGTVVFNGGTQSIEGSTTNTFNNITVKSGSTTTVNATNQSVKGVVRSDGTLNAGGNLTLLSDASQTALIDGSGTGSVLGNVIMQRYLAEGNGYKYISSPFQSATVNEFADDLDLNASFPTFYDYNENDASTGWVIYTNTSGALTPVKGYAANFGTSTAPKTIDATGVVNNGNMSAGTLYNNNQTYTQGFNLVGNPYPSPIDWEAPTGWTRTNLDDAIYFFNASEFQYTGYYSSYINGVSSDEIANNIIPAMQGFFVHVSDGTYPVAATFSMTNEVRVNNLNPVYHKISPPQHPMLRLNARYGEEQQKDALVVYFNPDATVLYDKRFDALKMMNTDERYPNLYAKGAGSEKYSITAMPEPVDSITAIPLGIDAKRDGYVVFTSSLIQNMPSGLHIYLADAQTKTVQELAEGKEYSFLLASGVTENRFSIIFGKKPIAYDLFTTSALQAYTDGANLMVNLNLVTGESGRLVLRNVVGQELYNMELKGYGYHTADMPETGDIYVLSLYTDNGVFSKKMFLNRSR